MVSSRTISANGQQVESGHRKSKTTFLDEEDEEVVLGKVVQRIADSTMLSMDSSEVLQVAKYDTGGYYKTHLDFFTVDNFHILVLTDLSFYIFSLMD